MSNIYLTDHFDLYNIETKNGSEFSIKIDSVPNTKLKAVIKNGAEIIFESQTKLKILANILNIDTPQKSPKQDIIFFEENEIYVAQFTGPTLQENLETMPPENDVFFLKINFKKII